MRARSRLHTSVASLDVNTSTSSCRSRSSTALSSSPGGISSASVLRGRETYSLSWPTASRMTSREATGFVMKPIAPALSARSRESSVDTTQIGMWRVDKSAFSRSRMRQPGMSGRKMSSEIKDG